MIAPTWTGYALIGVLVVGLLIAMMIYIIRTAWRTMLQRLSAVVLGLVLARYIPSRTLRRVLRVTVIPAVVAFVLQRVQRACGRRPKNKTSPAALR